MFTPLILAGVLPDFLRGLRIAGAGGPYGPDSPSLALGALVEELDQPLDRCLLAVGLVIPFAAPPELRRRGRTWTWLCARRFSTGPAPVQHLYLLRPLDSWDRSTRASPSRGSFASPRSGAVRPDRVVAGRSADSRCGAAGSRSIASSGERVALSHRVIRRI